MISRVRTNKVVSVWKSTAKGLSRLMFKSPKTVTGCNPQEIKRASHLVLLQSCEEDLGVPGVRALSIKMDRNILETHIVSKQEKLKLKDYTEVLCQCPCSMELQVFTLIDLYTRAKTTSEAVEAPFKKCALISVNRIHLNTPSRLTDTTLVLKQ